MIHRFSAAMAEVTRLTREGRVADATALIQALLRPHDSIDAPTPKREPTNSAHQRSLLDLVPPSVGSEHWSMPDASPGGADLSPTAIFPSAHVQETRGGLRESVRTFRFDSAMPAMAGRFEPGVQLTVPPGARFEEHTFANDAGRRKYKLYVPSCYAGEPLPLS